MKIVRIAGLVAAILCCVVALTGDTSRMFAFFGWLCASLGSLANILRED